MQPPQPPGGAGGQPPQPPPRPSRGRPPQPAQGQQAQAAGGSGAPQPTPLPPALSVTTHQIRQQAQQQVQERVEQSLAEGSTQLDDLVKKLKGIVERGTAPQRGSSLAERWRGGELKGLWWALTSTLAKLRAAHMDVQMSAQIGELKVGGSKVEDLCRDAVRGGGNRPPLGTSERELLTDLHRLLNMLTDLQTAVHHRQGKK